MWKIWFKKCLQYTQLVKAKKNWTTRSGKQTGECWLICWKCTWKSVGEKYIYKVDNSTYLLLFSCAYFWCCMCLCVSVFLCIVCFGVYSFTCLLASRGFKEAVKVNKLLIATFTCTKIIIDPKSITSSIYIVIDIGVLFCNL